MYPHPVPETVFESGPDYGGVTGLWAVAARPADAAHALVVVSFVSGSRALSTAGTQAQPPHTRVSTVPRSPRQRRSWWCRCVGQPRPAHDGCFRCMCRLGFYACLASCPSSPFPLPCRHLLVGAAFVAAAELSCAAPSNSRFCRIGQTGLVSALRVLRPARRLHVVAGHVERRLNAATPADGRGHGAP